MPFDVLDSAAYLSLSHPARSLLLELLRQYDGLNNGGLTLTSKRLRERGWTSNDVIARARDDLLRVGLLFQTVQGRRPSWASWFALTFVSLDRLNGFDPGVERAFERGAYRKFGLSTATMQNASRPPRDGAESVQCAPSGGAGSCPTTPPDGARSANFGCPPTPPDGNHIENHLGAAGRLTA